MVGGKVWTLKKNVNILGPFQIWFKKIQVVGGKLLHFKSILDITLNTKNANMKNKIALLLNCLSEEIVIESLLKSFSHSYRYFGAFGW